MVQKEETDTSSPTCDAVLFNSDTLSKVISYLPSIVLLNLALTCTRFSTNHIIKPSLIEESACLAIQDIATEEQLAALPHYEGESSLADYHYLQLLRAPLTFDQLVNAEYVNGDKSCAIRQFNGDDYHIATAFSNNILRAGKHYVSFIFDFDIKSNSVSAWLGVMRPGQHSANEDAFSPLGINWFQHFEERITRECDNNNGTKCCMCSTISGTCSTNDWDGSHSNQTTWEGMEESISRSGVELGMLLDLDEGILSVYKNGRKLGVMKRGLAGEYCWVVSMVPKVEVTIKRGTIPRD